MQYSEAIQFLYDTLPMFQKIGKAAFKKDLTNTLAFCKRLGNPQHSFPSVHIAGTNGKGSSAHSIAAVLQQAGYKTGLYTSPHLRDFTERIRINGKPVGKEQVIRFVEEHQSFIRLLQPSFFETTVAMAFDYFRHEAVDIAVIEVGMGGRLDSTNVITPLVSLITHISFDHTEFLGDTLEKIAGEKAGIIKPQIPVVIGERQTATTPVFMSVAQEKQAPLYFAQEDYQVNLLEITEGTYWVEIMQHGKIMLERTRLSLGAHYQLRNLPGILKTLEILGSSLNIEREHIQQGLAEVATLTGLRGRWQVLHRRPLIICDTGHNQGAFEEISFQLQQISYERLYIVLGVNRDKDLSSILPLLPTEAYFIFCQAAIPRAMPAEQLAEAAKKFELHGEIMADIPAAYRRAKTLARSSDCIFVGGSTFVVAEIDE